MRCASRTFLLTGSILLILAAGEATAQITSTLHGVVRDANGGVLPGATVTVESQALNRVAGRDVTDVQGRYRIAGLRPGAYAVKVELQGFATATLTDVTLQIDTDVPVDVTLQLATLQESVTVSADAPVVRAKDSDLQELITTRTIDNIPLNGRQFLDLLTLVPGTTARPAQSDQGANVTVFGERSITNSFLVDGLDNNDPFSRDFSEFFIQDAIQEFKVLLGGYQAEFGRASGAVANVITRSGTNDFHGRAFYFVRDDSIDSSNISGQEPQDLNRQEVGGTLGGPIRKGKTSFFDAFQYFRERRGLNFDQSVLTSIVRDGYFSPAVGGREPFGTSPMDQRYNNFIKLDHQFNARNQLFVSLNVNRNAIESFVPSPNRGFAAPPPGTLVLPSIASDIDLDTTSTNARHTVFFSNRTFLESAIRIGRFHYAENKDKPKGAEQIFPLTFSPTFRVWMSNASPIAEVDRKLDRFQWKEDLSYFKSTEKYGGHAFKVGVDLDHTSLDNLFLPTQSIIHGNSALDTRYQELGQDISMQRNQFQIVSANDHDRASTNNWSAYAQDSWDVGRGLTLNLGVRYDYATLFSEDKNNLAPRLGFAYDIGQKGQTVVRGSWGRFYDQTILEAVVQTPELGGVQFATGRMQIIPRGGAFFNNPALGAFGPLQVGGTRWLANPTLYSFLIPAGTVLTSGPISITGQGRPYIVYELLGIPVADPRNPPVLNFDNISRLTGGRLTGDQALAILNNAFPGPDGRSQFVFLPETGQNSINRGRPLALIFSFLEVNAIQTIKHPVRTPYTDSFNVGIERALGKDISVDAQVFIRRSRDLLARRVANLLDVPVGANCKSNTVDGSPCDRQLQYIGFLDSNVFTLSLQRRFTHNYAFMASYTYTDATDNFSTLRVPPTAGETSFLFNNRPELDIGRSLNAPEQVFVLSGLYQLPASINLAGIFRATSGRPFNAAGLPQDSDGDEQFDNRLVGTEKGGFLTDPFYQVDLRLAKQFGSGTRRATALIEFFNLFNRANPFIVNTVSGPEVGKTIQPLPGREIQIGVRFEF